MLTTAYHLERLGDIVGRNVFMGFGDMMHVCVGQLASLDGTKNRWG